MRIFNKLRGTKGIVKSWEEGLKSPAELHRRRVLSFWRKYGLVATKEAFRVSRRTLFRWQRLADERRLAPRSRAPKGRRRRQTPTVISEFIVAQRKLHPRLGKEKLKSLLESQGSNLSVSTVGRVISDLKRQGRMPSGRRMTLHASTGKLHELKRRKVKKQRRPKGADCLELDTVVRFIDGTRRYVVTALDTKTKFAFAGAYAKHSSATAADLLRKYALVSPIPIAPIQTDNGSEFADRFRNACENLNIVQYHTYPRCPKMNGSVERFNRTISEDFIMPNRYLLRDDVPAFNEKLSEWLLWYNTERPHAALGQVSPLRYITNQLTPEECHIWWTRTFI